jgi:hypothetical protein
VTVVANPSPPAVNQVSEVRLYNNDTVQHTVTLSLLDSATRRIVLSLIIQPGGHFVYTPGSGGQYLQRFWRSN